MSNRNDQEIEQVATLASLPHVFITGRAGHGKDSIGDHLLVNYGFERLSFSDGIRKEVSVAYANAPEPVTVQWQDIRESKELPQDRLALAHCNDDAFVAVCLREFKQEDQKLFDATKGKDSTEDGFLLLERMHLPRSPRRIQQIWGTEYRRAQDELYWLKYAEEKTDFSHPQVLTSVRYPNELEFGGRIDAIRVHVERPGLAAAADHVTEKTLPFDEKTIHILNDGTLEQLHAKVDAVMASFNVEAVARIAKHARP